MTAATRAPQAPTAPVVGFTEEYGTYTAFGYKVATTAARDGRSPSQGAGTAHEFHREALQGQSRELRRDNAIYAGMIRRARSFIVGSGFKLQCLTADTAWNSGTEKSFREWWRNPEITGKSGARCESMVADELLTCGEALSVLTSVGKIQLVEAEQLKGTSGRREDDGISRDENQTPTGYTISPYRAGGGLNFEKARLYSPDEVLYLSAPDRPSSSRAVPPCQASFSILWMIFDVCRSEAISWQIQSKIAVAITRQAGAIPETVAHQDGDASDEEAEGNPAGKWVTEFPTSLIFHGEPGDEIKGMERTAPAKNFTETLSMFFRLMGLPLGLPLELTLLDWTKSNYSQSRAVLEQAKVSFLEWQQLLEDGFYRAVFLWWLKREVAAGRIQAREDQAAHEWIKPAFPWIDQLAESQAHGENVDRGFETFGEVCKSRNTDRESQVQKLEAEANEAALAAARLKAKHPDFDFSWEQFAGKSLPKPVPVPAATAATSGKPAPKPGDTTAPPAKPAAAPAGTP